MTKLDRLIELLQKHPLFGLKHTFCPDCTEIQQLKSELEQAEEFYELFYGNKEDNSHGSIALPKPDTPNIRSVRDVIQELRQNQHNDECKKALEFYKKYQPSIKIFDIDNLEQALLTAQKTIEELSEFAAFMNFCKQRKITTKTHARLIDFWIERIVFDGGKVHDYSYIELRKRDERLQSAEQKLQQIQGYCQSYDDNKSQGGSWLRQKLQSILEAKA